jgi:pimeloyl-ACP methyl ester carboxylesterase
MSARTEASAGADGIRPFTVETPEAELEALRARIAATRWPEKETVADQSQGVQSATIQELARYWASDYDWRKCQARLNALPQFMTEIDGLDIHFIHVRSKHEDALPLIITHGWPGSIIEQVKVIDPLTNPTAHGGSASDAFHLVVPSMPGYGFSGKPTSTGWGPERMGRAWAELMKRLGYARYVAQGGDWGGLSSTRWACRHSRDCSPSTPTCLPPFQLTSTRRFRPATRHHPVSQPRNGAPMSSWKKLSSRSTTPG